jgi:hypothetical protein
VVPPEATVPVVPVAEPPLVEVLEGGGGVVDVPEPAVVVGVSAVEVAVLAELLDPQALSAPRQAIDITGRIEAKDFETKSIVICSHRRRDTRGLQVTRHAWRSRRQPLAVFGNPAICNTQTGSFAPPAPAGFALERRRVKHAKKCRALCLSWQTGWG